MKTSIIVGVVSVVIIAGGTYYFMSNKPQGDSPQPQSGSLASGEAAQPGTFTGSFADLASRTGSWKCTVDAATAQSVSSGVTYVADGKVRADFTSNVQGYGSIQSHMIADGGYAYTWSSMMPQGMKVRMAAAPGAGNTTSSGQGADVNQSYQYDCQPWSGDASVFVLPANVTFVPMGQ